MADILRERSEPALQLPKQKLAESVPPLLLAPLDQVLFQHRGVLQIDDIWDCDPGSDAAQHMSEPFADGLAEVGLLWGGHLGRASRPRAPGSGGGSARLLHRSRFGLADQSSRRKPRSRSSIAWGWEKRRL